MSVTLMLHVVDPQVVSEEEALYFIQPIHRGLDPTYEAARKKVIEAPHLEIGRDDGYPPAMVIEMEEELIGFNVLRTLSPELFESILKEYAYYEPHNKQEVEEFLNSHRGKKVFLVAW